MSKAKVLVIGGGGREHALAWKMAQSPLVEKVFVAPGNAGTDGEDKIENIFIRAGDFNKLLAFAQDQSITLTVVGPEEPLVRGIVDIFRTCGLCIFGCSDGDAQMEASKVYAKDIMGKAGIPTGKFVECTTYEDARTVLNEWKSFPVVIKVDGLAAGKGVYVCESREVAADTLFLCMEQQVHGAAGHTVLIEEFLTGSEVSLCAISDGSTIYPFPTAQDYKPLYEGNYGPNTGGMGVIAPVPGIDRDVASELYEDIARPIFDYGYTGALYPGLMMTDKGPQVLEYNCRFGDPEMQAYMRLLQSDLYQLLKAAAECSGGLREVPLKWNGQSVVGVSLVSQEYPSRCWPGMEITGIEAADALTGVKVFHAGTIVEGGLLITNGGRVLTVTAVGSNITEARQRVYQAISRIDFEGMEYREDIGAEYLQH